LDVCFGTKIKFIFGVNRGEASDAASLSPGGSAADLSAMEGNLVDDIAMSPVKIMVPLMGDQVACPICERKEIHLFFVSLSDLNKHLNQHHLEARIQWGCLYCEKSFPKLHGAKCHLPKCSGNKTSEGLYKCDACGMSFGTQRGLSTHERHAHPALRNIKRRGTGPP
jgi:ribosomal protein L37AE/L43A